MIAPRAQVMAHDFDFALLGLLWQRADYGYSVMNRLVERFSGWGLEEPKSRKKVYESIDRLLSARLVRGVDETGMIAKPPHIGRRAPRTRYVITELGKQAVREYLTTPFPVVPSPGAFYVRLMCAPATGPEPLKAMLDQWADACLDRLEEMGPPPDPDDGSGMLIILNQLATLNAHLSLQTTLDWISAARKALRRVPAAR